ncbi:MAG TPA: hypothetical protein VMI06_04065, partial [Terriglobia bacterium]|nr:hypothetical protein [Terriglobia bacterium]
MVEALTVSFLVLCCAGIVVAVFLPSGMSSRVIGCFGVAASSVMGAAGGYALASPLRFTIALWSLPPIGPLSLSIDRLAGLFLVVTAFVFFTTSI